ncbi:hypothetical protein FSW04_00470 [Baekduia soli]|uniref:GH16 domain-containing protein n=1 Tax=Baekduia soli TaxID=496014 RepID=A0A5B8TZN3_9ACTN|nr:hypothetical protein [Baekduia soli]QEC46190.1 hypothetical protein FSW04_00470 [Baekduia soli]
MASLLLLLALPAGAGAERYRRFFSWSGYRWQVRLATHENPGNNDWWDSDGNVRVRADGTLRLGITRAGARRRSVELATTRRLGYGRYRWVVESRLGSIDPYSVLALFTDDSVYRSPYGEQIFEFARWGEPLGPQGWAVSWSRRVRSYESFTVSDAAPYTASVTWRHSGVRLLLRDATGRVLYDVTRPVLSDGQFMVARMSYWLYPGYPRDLAPPPIIIRDFAFTPLARLPAAG